MKYQVVEIGEYIINVNEYNNMEEAMICFKTWIDDAKGYPMLEINKIYLTRERIIAAKWEKE